MTYQNLEFCFMLISTAVMKRGSMKIEEPHAERTRSQAARSTLSIESTTWQVLAIWRLRGRAGSETSLTQSHRRRGERASACQVIAGCRARHMRQPATT